MDGPSSSEKPLYCHWDTHDHDVLFMNEDELDQHLYSHFQQISQNEPVPADSSYLEPKAQKNIECHWDTCHEMFDIDEIMDHFRNSHQEESFHPHHGNCNNDSLHCEPKDVMNDEDVKSPIQAYVRLNPSVSSLATSSASMSQSPGVYGNTNLKPKLDPSTLPTLDTPESLPFECHRCMWCMLDGHICGEEFMTSSELNAHIVHYHVGTGATTCEWTGCERDRAPFCQRQKLVRHLQVHAKTLDLKCNVCDQAMSSEHQLKSHELGHTNERPYKCEQCGKDFKSLNSLKVHTRTHTGAKPLVCNFPGCGKRFAESSNLAKHKRTHQAPQFACPICGRKFTRKDHLGRHMRTVNHRPPVELPMLVAQKSNPRFSQPGGQPIQPQPIQPNPNQTQPAHQMQPFLRPFPNQLSPVSHPVAGMVPPRSETHLPHFQPYMGPLTPTQSNGSTPMNSTNPHMQDMQMMGPYGPVPHHPQNSLIPQQLIVPPRASHVLTSPLTPQ